MGYCTDSEAAAKQSTHCLTKMNVRCVFKHNAQVAFATPGSQAIVASWEKWAPINDCPQILTLIDQGGLLVNRNGSSLRCPAEDPLRTTRPLSPQREAAMIMPGNMGSSAARCCEPVLISDPTGL